jgi:formylglycine-generating enzyme required for sulfatase activity
MAPAHDADSWEEPTEDYQPTLPAPEAWPGDDRLMCRVAKHLRMDAAPVTHDDYQRFVVATGHPPPSSWSASSSASPAGSVPERLRFLPVTGVSIEDARAYARWANKRLPLQAEWTESIRTIGFDLAGAGVVWEWTASRHRTGHVVRGGPDRADPTAPGRFSHRSWEDEPARDVGFRCVVDG